VALAGRQYGVLSLAQAQDLGLSASVVHKRTTSGRLHRIHRGVYALVPAALLSRHGHLMAAVLAGGPGAVLSHRSAAELHELRVSGRPLIEVTVPGSHLRTRPGIEIHCSRTLSAADVTTVAAIPCTTVAGTLLDLGGILRDRQWERAYDQAAILEVLDARALDDQLARNPRHPGSRRMRIVLAEHRAGSRATWSELEELLLALCRGAGFPPPEVNAWVAPDDGEPAMRVDFLWRRQRLVVEADSHRFHGIDRAFETDRRRDQRLAVAGWKAIRVTWRQLHDTPEPTAQTIGRLLATGEAAAAAG
jgi:hypothetical protein